MCRSKTHASNVGLICNVATGTVSSQFHVVYDEELTTFMVNKWLENIDIPSEWDSLFEFNRGRINNLDDLREPSSQLSPIFTSPNRPLPAPSSTNEPESAPVSFDPADAIARDNSQSTNTHITSTFDPAPSSPINTTNLPSSTSQRSSSLIPDYLRPTHSKQVSRNPNILDPSSHLSSLFTTE